MISQVNLFSAYEARQLEAFTKPFILPVTIVTGFLGAGMMIMVMIMVMMMMIHNG